MHTQKHSVLPTVLTLAVFSVVWGSSATAGSSQGAPLPIEDWLAPVQAVMDVECQPPEGIRFKSTGKASWKLSGNLSDNHAVIELKPEEGAWDVSEFSYFRIDLVNSGPGLVWIRGRLDNQNALDWADSTPSAAFIMPGERATLGFPYPRSTEANDAPAIFDTQSGKPNGHRTHWKAFDPEKVTACRLIIQSTSSKLSLEEISISLAQPYGAEANAELLELPYLDPFGQVRQLAWPGKLQTEEELALRHQAEEKAFAADPGPSTFNQYGGWANGPQQEATGFFRTEKVKGKWWLVDPLGNLFFSHGANSIGFTQTTPLDRREALFTWLPSEDDPRMEDVLEKSKVHFIRSNLARTFGPEWQKPAYDRVHRRMRRWGMNTLGAWSDQGLIEDRKTPYTAILHVGNKWSVLKDGISDPFSDEFKQSLHNGLRKILGTEGQDPWCIGVFIDNEVGWAHKFVQEAFKTHPQQPVRLKSVQWLQEKYEDIKDLNAAWETDFSTWDSIETLPEEHQTAALKKDILALRQLIAEKYYKTCRDTMREVLPDHLYLGSRMHNAPPEIMKEAVKYVDVLSLNSYEPLSGSKVPPGADVPCLDTEFHFAAPDRGVPGVGLMPVGDQIQRSRSYVAYVVAGLMHPNVVGTHWFAYTDQSAAGRPGENYQIGFVDVTDTPYPIITEATRTMADQMYSLGAAKNMDLLEVLEGLWSEDTKKNP